MSVGFVLGPEEGDRTTSFGSRIEKIAPEVSGGWAFAVESCPPGFETALHIHHTEDGAFYILEGTLQMLLGEAEVEASPGTFVFMPRGVPHKFKVVSPGPAKWINVQGPTGDFGKLARELDSRNTNAGAPLDAAARVAISREFGVEILAPPNINQP